MKLHAKNIKKLTVETEYYGDTGYHTHYKYDLYNNRNFISRESGSFEPDFKELQKKFLCILIKEDLTGVMKKLNEELPDDVFTGHRICEDDFYENRTHDLRNPEITELDESRQYGREIFFKYFSFLKENFETLEKLY